MAADGSGLEDGCAKGKRQTIRLPENSQGLPAPVHHANNRSPNDAKTDNGTCFINFRSDEKSGIFTETSMTSPHPATTASPLREAAARFVRLIVGTLARVFYRINVFHRENLPATGGVLLLPNHITWVDALILQLSCPTADPFPRLRELLPAPVARTGLAVVRRDTHFARTREGRPPRR